MSITLTQKGRRTYISGDTYQIRDKLRAAGAHWDADARAWWYSRAHAEQVEQIIKEADTAAETPDTPGDNALVAGRVTYRGKTYYAAGRLIRGRTRWDDTVRAVRSRDGSRILLYYRDGARQFWADYSEVAWQKTYSSPQTIGGLRGYAEQARQADTPGSGVYRCGQCGGIHHDTDDGCYMCGCPRCPGARGGLCDED